MKTKTLIAAVSSFLILHSAFGFEGHISAITSRGGPPDALLYTVGTIFVRVEMTDTNTPNTVDILNRNSGVMTLLFPRNHCFMRLDESGGAHAPSRVPAEASSTGFGRVARPTADAGALPRPSLPQWPGRLPPGIGPTNLPGMARRPAMPMPPGGLPLGIGPQSQSTAGPSIPAVPNMPRPPDLGSMPMMPPRGAVKLAATGDTTNLLGYTCERYEIKQRGQTMEIWATDQLLPFQVYLPYQPPRAGPFMIELQWSEVLAAKKLFPLLASLRFDNGAERYHFEVQSIRPARLTDRETKLFQTPDDYVGVPPRPF